MQKWTEEQVEGLLVERGWYVTKRTIEHGVQFTLADETKVSWFQTGKVLVQGKRSDLKKEAEEAFAQNQPVKVSEITVLNDTASSYLKNSSPKPTRVFIVYGHDVRAREQLELLLRRLKLEPIVLQNIPGTGDTIIEKLEELTDADFACVLLTPDDEGRRCCREGESEEKFRP